MLSPKWTISASNYDFMIEPSGVILFFDSGDHEYGTFTMGPFDHDDEKIAAISNQVLKFLFPESELVIPELYDGDDKEEFEGSDMLAMIRDGDGAHVLASVCQLDHYE